MATDAKNLDEFLGTPSVPWWRRYLKWVLIGVGALLLVLLAFKLFGSSSEVRYSTAEVSRGNLTVTVSATGKLAPTNQVTVGSELSGLVVSVTADVNDRVAKGQPIALLDTSRLDDAIAQSAAALNANIAQVAQAAATVSESQAQLARLEEVSRLSGGRVPAKVEMEQARAAVQRAVASQRAAQANVASARAALSSNQTQRSKAVIRSPVNGVVLVRQIEPGQTVAASLNAPVLFVIAEDLSAMKLQVSIDEADVGSVQQGQTATFTVDAFPGKTFPATITRVDVGSNLTASAASATSSTTTANQVVSYGATLSVANQDLQLRPGMTATAEITTKAKPDVLLVPNAALRFTPAAEGAAASGDSSKSGIAGSLVPSRPSRRGNRQSTSTVSQGGEQTVYVLGEDGKPQAVKVIIGETNGTMTEVTGGDLKPGMKVITGQLAANSGGKSGSGKRRQGGQGGSPGQGGGSAQGSQGGGQRGGQ